MPKKTPDLATGPIKFTIVKFIVRDTGNGVGAVLAMNYHSIIIIIKCDFFHNCWPNIDAMV